MAMRCFGRECLTGAGARPLLASFFRADNLTAAVAAFVLTALALAALRAGVFFCEAARLAARDPDFLVGFFLATNVLPFGNQKRDSTIRASLAAKHRFADRKAFRAS